MKVMMKREILEKNVWLYQYISTSLFSLAY